MTEVLFYHLERQPLERVLPILVEKSLERGWRAGIRTGKAERVRDLDDMLWTYAETSFLPHSAETEGDLATEPALITTSDQFANAPQVVFIIERAALPDDLSKFERIVYMFDGRDDEALNEARAQWKEIRAKGLESTYWQQDENGRWQKKA